MRNITLLILVALSACADSSTPSIAQKADAVCDTVDELDCAGNRLLTYNKCCLDGSCDKTLAAETGDLPAGWCKDGQPVERETEQPGDFESF